MARKVLPTEEQFKQFTSEMLKMGFRKISRTEFRKDFVRLGLIAPRKKEGRETGFSFHANGLTVVVWTTFLEAEGKPRDEDLGWVIICEGDIRMYSTSPLRRTKNFIRRLLSYAWITKWKVVHRPLCPECKAFMKIARGKGLKAKYWICRHVKNHKGGNCAFLSWDHDLPPNARRFLESKRKPRRKYRAKRRDEGKPTDQAMLKRKKWEITRPENVK